MGGGRTELRAGDVVVVTGAAQGIGRAIASRAAMAGARVAVLDVKDEGADTVALIEEEGGTALFVKVDVSKESEVAAAAKQVTQELGVPFGLINNAGVFPRHLLMDTPLDDWSRALGINLTGTFLCAKAVVPLMLQEGRGAIVNIASGHGLQGAARAGAYCASKAGIISLTQTLALELAPAVRVNSVIPGVTETAQPLAATTVDELRSRGKAIPLGRIGDPDDIAKVVCFLLSDDAAYVTGQGIAVNGGRLMVP